MGLFDFRRYSKVLDVDIVRLASAIYWFGTQSLELTVLHVDVVYLVLILKSVEEDAVLRLLTCHILHIHVTYCWDMTTLCNLVWLIDEVDTHNGFLTLTYADVTHEDVLVDAATACIGLDAEHTVEVW